MSLQGKTVLVTGAGSGIGRAVSVVLAKQNARLLLVGRDEVSLRQTEHLVRAQGGKAHCMIADLCNPQHRVRIVSYCEQLPEGLYGLINNAGCSVFSLLPDQTEDDIDRQMQLNLSVPVLLTRSLLPALLKAGDARILNTGSSFGSIGYPGYTAYCASKFGLRGFTEALRRELADTALRVIYFAPRATATSLNAENVIAMNRELGNRVDEVEWVAEIMAESFIKARRNEIFIGWPEKFFVRINQVFSGIIDGALKKQLATIKRFAKSSQ